MAHFILTSLGLVSTNLISEIVVTIIDFLIAIFTE